MKGLVLALTLTLAAVAWQAVPSAPSADSGPAITAGIDAGGGPSSNCLQADGDWLAGCEGDEFRRITIASIDGSD